MSKVITASQLRSIVRAAAGVNQPPIVAKGKSIKSNLQSSIAKVTNVPKTFSTGTIR